MLLILLLLLLVLLALPATVLVFGQKFVDLVEQFNRLLLIRGQRLRAAFDLQLLDFRRKRGNLRLSLLGERRLVGVALRLLFVGLRPGGELRAERARIVKRVLLPLPSVEVRHVLPRVGLRHQVLSDRRRRHHRQLQKPREVMLNV